jgi:lipoyl-dependent peroxiredoxin
MATRIANAEWRGNLKEGKGIIKTESGALDASYSFGTRFENESGTNPDELIGAAHAGCFSMAFANELDQAGHAPKRVTTKAQVQLTKQEKGWKITEILLQTEADVPGIDEKKFTDIAKGAKDNCPVSQALKGVEIKLEAKLI